MKSSGPDVKIRGTAHHIGEKYVQLARDAQTSGDPVMAESYLQHAEHYFRLIAAAQQVQGPGAYQGQPSEANVEESDDDSDFGGMPDRFASPPERFAPAAAKFPATISVRPGAVRSGAVFPWQWGQSGFHAAGACSAAGAPFSGQELPGQEISKLSGKTVSGAAALSRTQWPRSRSGKSRQP